MPVYKDEKATKDGRQYYFVLYYENKNGERKKYKSKRYNSPSEAKKAEAKFILNTNEYANASLHFHELCDSYLEYYKGVNTESSYYSVCSKVRLHILPNFNKKVKALNNNDNENFKKYLDNKGFSIVYKNDLISLYKAIIKHGRKKFDINTNIDYKIEYYSDKTPKKKPKIWTFEEWQKFDDVVEDLTDKTLFNLLYFCGIRVGELQGLKWNDYKSNYIDINKGLTTRVIEGGYKLQNPKTKNSFREVTIPDDVIKLLEELKSLNKQYANYSDEWFIFGNDFPIHINKIRRHFNKFIEQAKLEKIRLHDLRHSAVSLLINMGHDEYDVADRMGHTVEMVREVYAHLFPKKKDKLLEALNNLKRNNST